MDKARGKGVRRERVLAHVEEPLPVDFETEEQLRAFEKGVLKRLLARVLDPSAARAAVDLARTIFHAQRGGGPDRSPFVARLMARFVARGPEQPDAEDDGDQRAADEDSLVADTLPAGTAGEAGERADAVPAETIGS